MIRGTVFRNGIKNAAKCRFVSTANSPTRFTTLANGLTIATEINPNATTASVGFWYGAGSRAENPYNNGVAALTTNLLASRSSKGVMLKSENSKESNGIVVQSTNENVIEAANAMADIINNAHAKLEEADFAAAKAILALRAKMLEASPSRMVLEHLNATAFQGYSLGLPTLGTADSITDLQIEDSTRLLEKHLVASNAVVAASGNFSHEQLIETLEKALNIPQGLKPTHKPALFLGSEVRMRDDTMSKAYVSIGVEGEGAASPAYYVAKVAAAVIGNFDQGQTLAHFTSPKLASIVQEYHIVDKYTHFSTSYSDTGLWGFNSEISNIEQVDDFVHFALKEWNRLSTSVTEAEVARAKTAVKTSLLASLDSPSAVASDIAKKVLLTGYRPSVGQALEKIDAITLKDVRAWAQVALWDRDIVISGTGQIEDLLDYMRCRNEMAMMRW